MKSQAIVSREYKVMLRPARFAGDEAALIETARMFWQDFSDAVIETVIRTKGSLGRVDKQRLIQFLDTAELDLKNSGYIFRIRRGVNDRRPEVTLKFRHEDRYLAESRRIRGRGAKAETKFEEDIKAPFVSFYSFSASAPLTKKNAPSALRDVVKLFPNLERRIDGTDRSVSIKPIGAFTARELVLTGARFRLAQRGKVDAECALIVWYDNKAGGHRPVAVEFSYRYGSRNGRYSGAAARRAFAVFETLQTLDDWIDPHPRTKTRFVLDKARA